MEVGKNTVLEFFFFIFYSNGSTRLEFIKRNIEIMRR